MSDSTTLILEGGKIILQSYFNYMKQAGKTDEEMEALYQAEKKQFGLNDPSVLEDV